MNTPRTNAERRALKKSKSYPVDPVSAEFARRLETELQTMTALADRLAQEIDTLTAVIGLTPIKGNLQALQEVFDQARTTFLAYEAHKKGNTP